MAVFFAVALTNEITRRYNPNIFGEVYLLD
jgi:hypothetical protein